MRTNIIKRMMLTLIISMVFMGMITSLPVKAASTRKLSAGSKKLSVGQEYTIKLKGLSKKDKRSKKIVRWSISDKKTVVFMKKGKYSVKIRARRAGIAKVTGMYKGKKYTCKITVGETQNIEDEEDSGSGEDTSSGKTDCKLNASDVTLYYMADEDKAYISQEQGHNRTYRFKVRGKSVDDVRWSIAEKDSPFKVSDDGKVYMWRDPARFDEETASTLVAKLSDGTVLKARLHGYSERGISVKKKMDEFSANYITADMSEYDKIETIAKYVEHEYDYVLYQSDWRYMVISGGGDCYASRYFVKYLCEAQGIKALALLGEHFDGKTLVKADGRMHIVVTGFNEPKPRRYMIMNPTDENIRNIARLCRIDLSYFD